MSSAIKTEQLYHETKILPHGFASSVPTVVMNMTFDGAKLRGLFAQRHLSALVNGGESSDDDDYADGTDSDVGLAIDEPLACDQQPPFERTSRSKGKNASDSFTVVGEEGSLSLPDTFLRMSILDLSEVDRCTAFISSSTDTFSGNELNMLDREHTIPKIFSDTCRISGRAAAAKRGRDEEQVASPEMDSSSRNVPPLSPSLLAREHSSGKRCRRSAASPKMLHVLLDKFLETYMRSCQLDETSSKPTIKQAVSWPRCLNKGIPPLEKQDCSHHYRCEQPQYQHQQQRQRLRSSRSSQCVVAITG